MTTESVIAGSVCHFPEKHDRRLGSVAAFVENYFDDPELMAAYDELHPPKNAE